MFWANQAALGYFKDLPPSGLFRKPKLFSWPPNDGTRRRVVLHPKIIVNNNRINMYSSHIVGHTKLH